jgi:hypothetical protein
VANDQQVAILFVTMALAVLADPKRSMYHPDSRRYYHLSRASMSLGEVIVISTFTAGIKFNLLSGYIRIPFIICDKLLGKRANWHNSTVLTIPKATVRNLQWHD